MKSEHLRLHDILDRNDESRKVRAIFVDTNLASYLLTNCADDESK